MSYQPPKEGLLDMAFSLIWLPDVLKDAGLKVAEVSGWRDRGRGDIRTVRGVICHHTATSNLTANAPTLDFVRTGSSRLRGPLSQLVLGRDGTFFVVAAGRANHAGRGAWQGVTSGNSSFIGIEAENTGRTRGSLKDIPWPPVQMDAYARGVAAILDQIGAGSIMCCGHREFARPRGRKIDPTFDMNVFRATVQSFMDGTGVPRPPIPDKDFRERPTLRRGASGPLVEEVQRAVGVEPDGDFGPKTEAAVRELQRESQLVADGIVGPQTWAAIDSTMDREPVPPSDGDGRPTLRRPAKGEEVEKLQKLLGIKVDGDFGPNTEAAVRDFQRSNNLVPDGIVGPRTWAALSAGNG